MGVRERMIEAAYAAPKAAGVLAVDVEIIAQACADVATEDNGKLLDMHKARGAEIEKLTTEVERLQKEADVHSEWRKAANRRVRELEAQLADAAASGMTKREHFAASAFTGLLANAQSTAAPKDQAEWAVKCGDALLAALEAKP